MIKGFNLYSEVNKRILWNVALISSHVTLYENQNVLHKTIIVILLKINLHFYLAEPFTASKEFNKGY